MADLNTDWSAGDKTAERSRRNDWRPVEKKVKGVKKLIQSIVLVWSKLSSCCERPQVFKGV